MIKKIKIRSGVYFLFLTTAWLIGTMDVNEVYCSLLTFIKSEPS